MQRFLNTLYITTQKTYLKKRGETVAVVNNNETVATIPLINLDSIVCFGNVLVSPFLLGAAFEHDITISYLTESGRFLARVQGPVSGNVLLRKAQYRFSDDVNKSAEIARFFILGKIANQRAVLQRAVRDHKDIINSSKIEEVIEALRRNIVRVEKENNLEILRGVEGESAEQYFSVFNELILSQKDSFIFTGRNRRPPLDKVNALLSYVYTLLYHDMISACEVVGLDPAVGFLHKDRPGRCSLALDMMEEFRPIIADRIVLNLINRQEITSTNFETTASGAVIMDEEARKKVIESYQTKKSGVLSHPFLDKKMYLGILLQVQARLFARYIRGDLDGYPFYLYK